MHTSREALALARPAREGEFGADFKFSGDAKVGSGHFSPPRVATALTSRHLGTILIQLCQGAFTKYQTLALGEMFEKHHCHNPGLGVIDRPD